MKDALPKRSYLGALGAQSSAMVAAFEMVARFAPTEVSVTFLGETGTGKDVLAHALHEQSHRASAPFVVFDCGAIAPNLAESELLGHERGAFTGAVSSHVGAFERAQGGTLFLDEIGDMPLDLQPRLLRALESRTVRRVGGSEDRPLDVRVVAATHRDLRADVAAGKFRQDLYFRLAAAVIPVPPLRDRKEDLPLLVDQLLFEFGRGEVKAAESTLTALEAYDWPGNVRELKNTLACAMAYLDRDSDVLLPEHVRLPNASASSSGCPADRLPLAGQRLDVIERAAILQTLARTEGNKVRAAKMLGIAPSTLYEKLKKYDCVSG